MTYLHALTIFHTALSLAALAIGAIAVAGLFKGGAPGWARLFLLLAVATSVTGYFFPLHGLTPAVIVGVIALAILAIVLLAQYRFDLAGRWRWIYAAGMVASLYLLAFVGVAQAFQKIAPLARLAPTQSEPPFAIAQIAVLGLFLIIGWRAAIRFQLSATAARPQQIMGTTP